MRTMWIHGVWGLLALTTQAGAWQTPVPTPISSAVGGNGDSYVTAVVPGQSKVQLFALTSEGAVRWQRPLKASASSVYRSTHDQLTDNQGQIVLGGDRVCVKWFTGRDNLQGFAPYYFVAFGGATCFDTTNGNEVPVPGSGFAFKILPAGGFDRLLVDGCESDCEGLQATRIRHDAEGNLSEFIELDASGLDAVRYEWPEVPRGAANVVAVIGSSGRGSILIGGTQGALTVLAHDGAATSRHPLAGESSGILLRVRAMDDDTLLLHSWSQGVHQLRAIAVDGSVRWRFTTEGGLDDASGRPPFLFDVDGDSVVALVQFTEAGMLHSQLTVLDAATGGQRWQQEDLAVDARGADALDALSGRGLVLLGRSRPGATFVEALSLEDGARVGLVRQSCSQLDHCSVIGLGLAADDSLRVLSNERLSRFELAELTDVAAADQSALSGSWYDPATTGQGVLFEYAPATGDLFGAWFTYADTEVEGAAGLRWYTLGARVEPDQTHVTMDIYRNRDGSFDGAPITTSDIIGSAELILQRCGELSLNYVFSGGELAGLSGIVPMQRLTPNAFDCVDAEGETAAAPAQPDLTRGIDRRHAGAWYDPATSGQGLVFDVRPPALDGSDPGVLVGGWFTYDAGGSADDDQAQHWFLLQADLAGAQDGNTTAVIYSAADGRFDQAPTDNVQVVGTAEISFTDCETGQLNYQFDQGDAAGSFAGRSGQIPLVRLLPCPE